MKTILTICMVCCLCLASHADDNIYVKDLNFNLSRVIGWLGKPLGSRTVISGTWTNAMFANPIAVLEIDGKPTTNSIVMDIHTGFRLKAGTDYKFEGYESGEFGSSPYWLNPTMQQSFQFYSYFIVTKVIKPKKE